MLAKPPMPIADSKIFVELANDANEQVSPNGRFHKSLIIQKKKKKNLTSHLSTQTVYNDR